MESTGVADALAIVSPLQAMTIVPPGTTNTLLLVGGLTVADGDVDADEVVVDVTEGDTEGDALVLEAADPVGELTAMWVDAEASRDAVLGAWVVGWTELRCEVLLEGCTEGEAGVGLGGPVAAGLVTGFALALADDCDAADWEAAATALATPPWVESCCVPLTSCPTRSTAVSVMAVTTAHESTQPSARVRGRPDQLRGFSAGAPDCRRRLSRGLSGRLPWAL